MSHRTRLALGLAGGYLLGRYKKTRVLGAIAAVILAKRLGDTVVKRSAEALGSPPELEKLAGYGREAAVAVLSGRINNLSQRIHDRTESIQRSLQPDNGKASGDDAEPSGKPEPAEEAAAAQASGGQERSGEQNANGRPGEQGSNQDRPPRKRQGGQSRSTDRDRQVKVSGRPSMTPGRG